MKQLGSMGSGTSKYQKGMRGYARAAILMDRKAAITPILAIFVAAIFRVALPWPLKWVFDMMTGNPADTTPFVIGFAASLLILISAFTLMCLWHAGRGTWRLVDQTITRIRRGLFGYLAFATRDELGFHAAPAAKSSVYLRTLRDSIGRSIVPLLKHSTSIVLMVVVMMVIDWRLGLLATAMLPLFWFPTNSMIERIRSVRSWSRSLLGPNTDAVSFFAHGVAKMVLAFGVAVILWLGAGFVMKGELSVGSLSIFLAYLVLAREPMAELQQSFVNLYSAREAREEIEKLLVALDIRPPAETVPNAPKFEGRLAFTGVTLHDDGKQGGLENVTLAIRPGRRIAFVGASNCGRLPLARIITGLIRPERGRVLIDGLDVDQFDPDTVRAQISAIPHDGICLEGTVRDYVSGDDPTAPIDDVKEALSKANSLSWAEKLPDGVDTVIGANGLVLSRGELKLLGLARAAYRRPPLLIIDRPTEGLGEEAKRAVMLAIDKVAQVRTTLLLTDDVRLAARCDQIVFMDKGTIVQTGSHADLVQEGGAYADFFHGSSPGPVLFSTKHADAGRQNQDRRQPQSINPFVFIVGCPGSGVSLVQQLLNRHSMMSVANDTHFIPAVLAEAGHRGDIAINDDLIERVRSFQNFDRLGLSDVEVYRAGGTARTFSGFVTNIYNRYAEKSGKELVGIKAPSYCRNVRLLHELFPWARYIHVVRDGRDVAMSVLERTTTMEGLTMEVAARESVPVGTSALWWQSMVSTARRDGVKLGGRFYTELRFEDLVEDPETVLRGVTGFLDLSFEADMLADESSFMQLDVGANGFQDWRSQMSRSDVALFEALAGDALIDLGYGRGVATIPPDVQVTAKKCLDAWGSGQAGQKTSVSRVG
ncbi:MAG TPA: sulfotransferase [Rhodothermales bacterium]|nr:sulfotransferase [Rhodothermales bacterium]